MITVIRVTDEPAMRDLRPHWQALWQRDPAATPFQSPAWLFAWWQFFGTGAPVILGVWHDDQLVGLLPLYLLTEGECRKLLPIGVGLSDYIDALVDPAMPEAADGLVAALTETPGCDETWLPDVPADGALARALAGNNRVTAVPAAPCPVLSLPHDQPENRTSIPHKTRRYLQRAHRRASAVGSVKTETVDATSLDSSIAELFRLHEKRWQARGEPGVVGNPVVRAFHEAAARALAREHMLTAYRLSLDDATLAVYYGCAAKSAAYAYLIGFDPDRTDLAPGAQIIAHAIGEACTAGLSRFDFLRGDEPYKYSWGAVDRPKLALRLAR